MKPGLALASLFSLILSGQSASIRPEQLRGHLAFLADDLLEGRGMGQRGGELAVRYLETQFQAMGLRPANGDSYLQAVSLVGMEPVPKQSRCVISAGNRPVALTLGQDFFLAPSGPKEVVNLDAGLIFVGHGTASRRNGWNDYQGLKVAGKVLVMLMGPRGGEDGAAACGSPEQFFGRWSQKLEAGLRRGAAGVLIVHTPDSAGYDWSVARTGWSSERFAVADGQGGSLLGGMIHFEAAERLLAAAGQDLKGLIARAQRRDFRPVALNLRAKATIRSRVRHLVQHNVAGWIPGTEARLKEELVLYSAHWDHFGKREDGRIFNGAVDNGTGLAALLAIAQAAAQNPTSRSQMFVAFTGEEAGLLGSTAYVRKPLRPLDKTAAVLNLESLNFLGETRDISALGADASDLGAHCRKVATAMGLRFRGSAPDPAALFFRADHFAFVRAGIPALSPGFSLDGGWDYVQDPVGSQAIAMDWLRHGYHQPSDRYDPAWKLDGLTQQTRFIYDLGQTVGQAPEKPRWLKGAPDFTEHP